MQTEYGVKWDREVPNELLYIPICSFLINNPHRDFHIICPTTSSKILFNNFLERILDISNLTRVKVSCETSHPIALFPPGIVFLQSIENIQSSEQFQTDILFLTDSFKVCDDGYIKKLKYEIEENESGILGFASSEDDWDKFYFAWNCKTPIHYFWNKYVAEPFLEKIERRPCFSFCLYGDNPKYIQGFLQNIELAKTFFPNFGIALWISSKTCKTLLPTIAHEKIFIFELINVHNNTIPSTRVFMTNHWFPTEIYSRDADSRIGEREVVCINNFIQSQKKLHIVRDHYWHKSRIMAGTFGLKYQKNIQIPDLYYKWFQDNSNMGYGSDEKFLSDVIYNLFKDSLYIQTNIVAFSDEITHPIHHDLNQDGTDFIGNCWSAENIPEFRYWDFSHDSHLNWLANQCGGLGSPERIIYELSQDLKFNAKIKRNQNLLTILVKDSIARKDLVTARELFADFEFVPRVDEGTLRSTVLPYYKAAKQSDGIHLVATTDVTRESRDISEEIVCIGDFPYGVRNLPNKERRIYLPLIFYRLLEEVGLTWEHDPAWDLIGKIYVLNLEERLDRWVATLGELARMGAPLNRIHHYKAKKAEPVTKLEIYAGATKNHVDCVRDFIESGLDYCLILEDDIQFCSNTDSNKRELREFFARNYDFDICMISYSKDGPIEPKDDMLFLSRQPCTTSSGYILRRETAEKVHAVLDEGLRRMRESGDYSTFCCDRYWAKIQGDGKFFLFRNKIAFQRVVYSNITGCNNLFLD